MQSRHFLFSAFVLFGLLYLATSIPPVAHAASADFVIAVKTDNPGASTNTQFTIPTTGSGYNYNIDCNNDDTDEATAQTGNYTCNYGSAGTYTIRIKDNGGAKTGFPRIYFNSGGDAPKLLTIVLWGTGKWTSMAEAFAGCQNLNGSASDSPDLSNVTDTSNMFLNDYSFNGNIASWNTTNITNMSGMFKDARSFNQNIGGWNTANVTNLSYMFYDAFAFNQNISSWNTANVTNLSQMFAFDYAFNQNIGSWNTANVTNMSGMFEDATAFNQDIGGWNTAKVTDMSIMFELDGAFNRDIGGWNTAKVTDMHQMFEQAYAFNQNIGGWNTSHVTNMSEMFRGASVFNQGIGKWKTGQVTDIHRMFQDAHAFNQNIGSWNTSHVTDMNNIFNYALAFNQNLGTWNVSALTNADGMFTSIGLTTANYDALLIGWNAQTLHRKVKFDGGSSQYCNGQAARAHLIKTDHWSITDGGRSCADLQTVKTVKKLNPTNHKYTVKVKNLGPDPALNVTLTDPLPRHYVISQVNSKTANCDVSGRTVTCKLAEMTPGATFQVTIQAAPHGAMGQNCAKVKADTIDPNPGNNKACVAVPQ